MDDLISRQAAIDEIRKDILNYEGILTKLPSVNPQEPKWTSVSERLPEIDAEENKKHYYDSGYTITSKPVLVTVEGKHGRYVTIGRYGKESDGDSKWLTANGKGCVVAWMEKPEPYRAESEE